MVTRQERDSLITNKQISKRKPDGVVDPTGMIVSGKENSSGRFYRVREEWNRPVILNQTPDAFKTVICDNFTFHQDRVGLVVKRPGQDQSSKRGKGGKAHDDLQS